MRRRMVSAVVHAKARWVLGTFVALVIVGAGSAAASVFVGSGTHPWVIVLCNFQNQQLDPAPASFFNQEFGDAGAGIGDFNAEDYWHDVSFGQLSTAGTVVADGSHADANGWYTVPETRDTWGYTRSRFAKIQDCANAAASDVNYANYYGVIAVFPEAQANTTTGLNTTDTAVTLNASNTSPTPDVTTTNYFPTPPFLMNIDDGSGNNSETVNVTAVSGSTFTIVRGQNGTTAKSHNSGASASVPGDYGETDNNPSGPGPATVTLTSGTFHLAMVVLPNEGNLTGAVHEMGHGFGFIHTRKLSYSTTDYKDATDDMSAYDSTYEFTTLGTAFGGAVLGSLPNDKGPGLTSANLDFQGWIPSARHDVFNNSISTQSTISLHALSDPNALSATGYLQARIPASVSIEDQAPNDSSGNPLVPTNPTTCSGGGYACTTSQYYTVDYRQRTGWDSGFPHSAVVLHLLGSDQRAYWVDQTPQGHGGLLYAGDEYVDAASKAYVAVNSISGSNAQITLGSRKINASLAYAGATSGDFNDQVTLAGDLTVAGSGAPVPDEPVVLTVGAQSCIGTTDPTGHASCTLTLNQDPGGYTASAAFGGDTAYAPASGSASFTINQEDTKIIYNGATSGDYHDPATFSARLLDAADNTPIAGKTISFQIGASATDTCSAPTDATGTATCSISPTQAAGGYAITAAFAGDTDYLASSDASQTFTITKEETSATYTGPTVILGSGSTVTLKGQLLEDGLPASPIAGRAMTLSLGSQTCVGTSDATGTAACSIAFTGALGSEPLVASFTGNAYYLPSTDTSKTAVVFAFPSSGAFVLGDATVAAAGPATTMTWWGDNWSSLNPLGAGPAPSSFKGFADAVTLPSGTPPATCGGPWTARPGNSGHPPAAVPSYMGVFVASGVTKSGSTISGDTVKIVVVKTAPGYAGNPGAHGTGTIVATYCP